MGQQSSIIDDDTPPNALSERSVAGLAEYIKSGKAKKIVVMTGAGISTAAGIPDFRSPNTGLYANLARLNLPFAEAVFDISYFRQCPEPFYVLAKELYPGRFHPTVSHVFIALLASKGLLFHLFTQNIDCLERAAGVPSDLIVEAHGSFATQRCIDCGTEYPDAQMREHVAKGEVPRCIRKDNVEEPCSGLVKPDIVFFGEQLPATFRSRQHFPVMADLALVMGTSLQVHPFAGLPDTVREDVPRALFNMERVGSLGSLADDVLCLGDCDSGVRSLADVLGWRDELEAMWRSVVGDEEAERQLKNATKRELVAEDEVAKLADEVEQVLQFDDKTSGAGEKEVSLEKQEGDKAKEPAHQEVSAEGTDNTTTSSAPNAGSTTPALESESSPASAAESSDSGTGQPRSVSTSDSDANDEKKPQATPAKDSHEGAANPTAVGKAVL